jgi:hypothetical protein
MEKLQTKEIIFENITAKERHILYIFAIYYGYIWYDVSTEFQIEHTWLKNKSRSGSFCPEEIMSKDGYNKVYELDELIKRRLYHKILFDHKRTKYKWKSGEDLTDNDILILKYYKIRKITTLKLMLL